MVDGLLIAIVVVMSVVLLGVNFYLMALYVHTEDSGFGTQVVCKVLVMLGTTLSWAQVLLLPMDVSNSVSNGGMNMKLLWLIVYMAILACVTVLFPLAIYMYETDEEKPIITRICTSLCYQTVTLVIVVIILFVSWNFLKFADIPVLQLVKSTTLAEDSASAAIVSLTGVKSAAQTYTVECSWAVYCMAIMSFVGWILLIIFGGVGLFALPVDMFFDFLNRPKLLSSAQGRVKKESIVRASKTLLEDCQKLLQQEKELASMDSFFSRWQKKREIQAKIDESKAKFQEIDKFVETFELQLQYDKMNPLLFWIKLPLSIIFMVITVMWLIQMCHAHQNLRDDREGAERTTAASVLQHPADVPTEPQRRLRVRPGLRPAGPLLALVRPQGQLQGGTANSLDRQNPPHEGQLDLDEQFPGKRAPADALLSGSDPVRRAVLPELRQDDRGLQHVRDSDRQHALLRLPLLEERVHDRAGGRGGVVPALPGGAVLQEIRPPGVVQAQSGSEEAVAVLVKRIPGDKHFIARSKIKLSNEDTLPRQGRSPPQAAFQADSPGSPQGHRGRADSQDPSLA